MLSGNKERFGVREICCWDACCGSFRDLMCVCVRGTLWVCEERFWDLRNVVSMREAVGLLGSLWGCEKRSVGVRDFVGVRGVVRR